MIKYRITIKQAGDETTGFLDNRFVQNMTETPYLLTEEQIVMNAKSKYRWDFLLDRMTSENRLYIGDITCDSTTDALATSFIIDVSGTSIHSSQHGTFGEEALLDIISTALSKSEIPLMVKMVSAAPLTSTNDDRDFSRIGIVRNVELEPLFNTTDEAKSSITITQI